MQCSSSRGLRRPIARRRFAPWWPSVCRAGRGTWPGCDGAGGGCQVACLLVESGCKCLTSGPPASRRGRRLAVTSDNYSTQLAVMYGWPPPRGPGPAVRARNGPYHLAPVSRVTVHHTDPLVSRSAPTGHTVSATITVVPPSCTRITRGTAWQTTRPGVLVSSPRSRRFPRGEKKTR